jgi:hypothetical protein
MDDDELKRLRERFVNAEEKRPGSTVKAFVKRVTDRLGRKLKKDDFKRFHPKRRKKAS